MTTSLAHFTRGNWSSCLHANPAGMVWGMLTLAIVPWAVWSAWAGRTVGVDRPDILLALAACLLTTVLLSVWVWRWG